MKLKKRDIQIKTSAEQEGIYRNTLSGFHVDPTYTVGKALSIYLWKVSTLGSLGTRLGSFSIVVKT